ncbi:dihydrolipoamide dehydrogenase [uncultured Winogradskyella sp.]|uniref:dihydrolipoamide dehydrogenase n=1 Tax=uncultured Winogradskyella sp. TaxID=395353 RepID=UPI0030EC1819|tara:strand:+ start:909 stop:1421 length:513 start_codon:yes stop_codon:yes gene_type:complete
MKKLLSFITVFTLLLTSCTGEQGPPGFDGYDGQDGLDGVNFVGQSFERTIHFTSANNYQESIEIPIDVALEETDMVLVYHLRGQLDGFDIWKSLPETIYINSTEQFQYNFEHNYDFVTIFIESHPTFDFNLLLDDERFDQTFRIVVLPVDFVNSSNLDVNNYDDVMQYIQ